MALLILAPVLVLLAGASSLAQRHVDIGATFEAFRAAGRDGLARKTMPVDVRPAREGEVVVTLIKGEGRETQSQPAGVGDMVVRNRCPETGNEEILVSAAAFARRYDGPVGPSGEDGYRPYRPRGLEMRYAVVSEADGVMTFVAPWGEPMTARPGDVIVQDPEHPKDTYRVQRFAFACTYEIVRAAKP